MTDELIAGLADPDTTGADAFVLRGMDKVRAALAAQPYRAVPSFEDVLVANEALLRHLVEDHPSAPAAGYPEYTDEPEAVALPNNTHGPAMLEPAPSPTPEPVIETATPETTAPAAVKK